MVAMALVLSGATYVRAGVVWVDTFDAGVGHFDQTIGLGDARFAHYPGGGIDAVFIRDGANDRRYAALGHTFNANVDVLGYSFHAVPFASSRGGGGETSIGFWNSASDNAANRIGINFATPVGSPTVVKISGNYADGGSFTNSTTVPFSFLRSYAVSVNMNGPAHQITADVFQLPDEFGLPDIPTYIGTLAVNLDAGRTLNVDSIGFGGGFGAGQATLASIDNVAFVIPEPTTLALLTAAGAALGRHRRRS
ncbi:MAG: PEP-CTERM sorting domain-containing protein [Phycisphaerales bacterium]|nr:PEP-CTERM sorting domain-containing protein [Phycisphaerales bacterium]